MIKKVFKATAVSPANIAFIKFWGKKNTLLNIPFNNSISMNLSNCLTTTTVEFSLDYLTDSVMVDGKEIYSSKKERVIKVLDIVREKAKMNWKAKVVSQNNFPQGAGIASSASAFSALALSASKAARTDLSRRQLSILARNGSGSAARSVFDGFSEWEAGNSDSSSYAIQIAKSDYWHLVDIVAITNKEEKKISSTEGHELATTSPYFQLRLKRLPQKIKSIKKAFFAKDFLTFGNLLEEEATDLHLMAMTSTPPIFYWNEGTMEIIHAVQEWRKSGLNVFFTIDAGPNVHLLTLSEDADKITRRLKEIEGIKDIIVNKPTEGTKTINTHLF